jgi:small neutral amino acid transporter SnatA (MarC family)
MTDSGTPPERSRPGRRVLWAGLGLALGAVLAFGVLAPPERCPSVGAAELRRAAQASLDWFVRNQAPAGTWLYLYDAEDDTTTSEYNEVRHAGVTMGLYQAAAAGLPGALRSADRGAEWALDRLVERDGWAAFELDGRVATGSTALLVAGLVIRREATGDERYDEVLRRLGRFLVAQTEPSGAVLAEYDPVSGAPLPGEYSKYYTGEAYWALARLHVAFPSEGWGEAADRIGAYLASRRDEVEDHWPPIPDHWAAYGMADTARLPERGRPPLTGDELAYARRQAELFGVQVRWVSQRLGPWGALVRGSYVPRGGGYGVIGEALTGWWLTAREEPRLADLREPLAERAGCIAALAVSAQSSSEDARGAARPGRVEGAWFADGETRMDDQQHALAALLRTIPIVAAGTPGAVSDPDVPSGWLWALVLLLALNPARAAFGVPRAGGSPRTAVRGGAAGGGALGGPRPGHAPRTAAGLAAAGGALGGLAVCVAALAGEPLLDALDVSEPSFRVAAGVLAGLAGAADLLRRPPRPEPALPGWRAALVPVAVPLVARPALLLLALGAGAEQGALVAAGAMAVAVALLAVLAAAWPVEGPGGRALRWAGRLLAAGLVACGVVLAVDGVLDV